MKSLPKRRRKIWWKVKRMKATAKALIMIWILALTGSVTLLGALALEDAPNLAQTQREAGVRALPGAGYGSALRPEGFALEAGIDRSPAVQGEVRIPRLEAAPQPGIAPIQEEITPISGIETPFIPAPNTGYASSFGGVFGAAALLGSALLLVRKKKSQN